MYRHMGVHESLSYPVEGARVLGADVFPYSMPQCVEYVFRFILNVSFTLGVFNSVCVLLKMVTPDVFDFMLRFNKSCNLYLRLGTKNK